MSFQRKRKDFCYLRQWNDAQKRRQRTFLYAYILLALFILLVAASYTWFSLSKTPRVSDMDVYISSQTGLELAETYEAPDDDWGEVLDFANIVGTDTQLKPASWSGEREALVTTDYGTDGRIIGDSYTTLTDEENANRNDDYGYYVKGTFYARSDSQVTVSLGDAVEVNGGKNTSGTYVIGTPLWNTTTLLHDDGGQGAETAVRLGIRITKIDPELGKAYGDSEFYIYEPNYDVHIDPEIEGEVETENVDDQGPLTDEAHMIRQTASTWSEANPVQSDVTIKSLGKFDTTTELFELEPGEMAAIDLYIWLEGQDVDCSNLIEDAQIIANIQLTTDYSAQSGLVKIR